jgi:hypothetical protein
MLDRYASASSPSVSANAKALQSRQTNTTTLNINTNAVTKQSKTRTRRWTSVKRGTVKPTVSLQCRKRFAKRKTCKAEDRPTERPTESFALSIDTNAVTGRQPGDGDGGDGRTLQSSSTVECRLKASCVVSAVECESGCKAEDMQKQKTDQQSDQQNRLPQYRHQRCHSEARRRG